jgi:hypothetical protein
MTSRPAPGIDQICGGWKGEPVGSADGDLLVRVRHQQPQAADSYTPTDRRGRDLGKLGTATQADGRLRGVVANCPRGAGDAPTTRRAPGGRARERR